MRFVDFLEEEGNYGQLYGLILLIYNIIMSTFILGIDEVGKGCVAGPIVVGGVVMCADCETDDFFQHIKDSKLVTKKKRNELDVFIREHAVECFIREAPAEVIDRDGIVQAQYNLVYDIINSVNTTIDIIISDFMKGFVLDRGRLAKHKEVPYKNEIQGDSKYKCVGAASIIAKVYRDTLMTKESEKYPLYGFDHHVGYCTEKHVEAIYKHGPCPIHRMSFEPLVSFCNNRKI